MSAIDESDVTQPSPRIRHESNDAAPPSGGMHGGTPAAPLRHLGSLLLLFAAGASALMCWSHISGHNLPGCGVGSACAEAASSIWGRIPGVEWPVSFAGLAYFLAALAVWSASAGRVGGAVRAIMRISAVVSVGYVVVMITGGYLCAYCLTAHAANLLFLAILELFARSALPVPGRAGLGLPGAVFVAASAALGITDRIVLRQAEANTEKEFVASTQRIAEEVARQSATPAPPAVTAVTPAATASRPAVAPASAPAPATITGVPEVPDKPFTGRYHYGAPLPAPIRIVVFSDYQCRECKRLEEMLFELLPNRSDVSLSAKHFPLNTECNPYATKTLHPSACLAARVAEAAGILGGDAAYWAMHRWLFEQGGVFNVPAMDQQVKNLGLNVDEFRRLLKSEEVLSNIHEDVAEGIALGLSSTPMVFINGIELRGWGARQSLQRVLDALGTHNPGPRGPEFDHPPPAARKIIDDWLSQRRVNMPPRTANWPRGAETAPVRVVVYGDYRETNSIELDRVLRELAARRPGVCYEFRFFPFNGECNPVVKVAGKTDSCIAVRAAGAAGLLGGTDAFWLAHEWLMSQGDGLIDRSLLEAAAAGLGIDGAAWIAELESPRVQMLLDDDVAALGTLRIKGIPTAFVNNREVPRWKLADQPMIEQIIDQALRTR